MPVQAEISLDPDRNTEAETAIRPQEDLLADFAEIRLESESCALRCRSLVKRYGKVTAVDGLDLEVRVGECFGLLGPNGAGKTTTVEILEGLNEPDAGTVRVLGRSWSDDPRSLR